MSRTRVGILACLGAVALAGCPSDDSEQGSGGLQADIATALTQAFAKAPALMDGLDRLLVAAAGGPADGVTITPNSGGFTAVIGVDLDNDGSRETNINGDASGDFIQPTFVSFTGPAGTSESASATVSNLGTDLSVSTVGGDFPSPSLGIETIITGGDFFINLESGIVNGDIEIEVLNDADPVGATVHFEPDGVGGWHLRVTGRNDSFEFFVPLRAAPSVASN